LFATAEGRHEGYGELGDLGVVSSACTTGHLVGDLGVHAVLFEVAMVCAFSTVIHIGWRLKLRNDRTHQVFFTLHALTLLMKVPHSLSASLPFTVEKLTPLLDPFLLLLLRPPLGMLQEVARDGLLASRDRVRENGRAAGCTRVRAYQSVGKSHVSAEPDAPQLRGLHAVSYAVLRAVLSQD